VFLAPGLQMHHGSGEPVLWGVGELLLWRRAPGLCRWISCRKNTGYHATDPKIRTQGAERGRSWIATKHGDESLECRMRNALQRERDRALPRFRALVVR
jgi:hypothetical protein